MQNETYILLTSAKNEEDKLPNLFSSMVNQTCKPVLWLIVDDGSTDDTPAVIKAAKGKHKIIQSIRLDEHARDTGKHYAYVCNTGFDFAIKYCERHNIQYGYIGIVDADMTLEPNFFEKLIREFKKNLKLGIASGSEYYYNNNNELVLEAVRDDLPMGCMRLWRKDCFEDTGGYLLTKVPDAVSNAKAIIGGWDTKQFHHIKFVSTRAHASAEGHWRGYKQFGFNNYFISYTPIHALLKGIKLLSERPYYTGFAYLYGYFGSLILRKKQIDDDRIKAMKLEGSTVAQIASAMEISRQSVYRALKA